VVAVVAVVLHEGVEAGITSESADSFAERNEDKALLRDWRDLDRVGSGQKRPCNPEAEIAALGVSGEPIAVGRANGL
jgi:hypothetical protein